MLTTTMDRSAARRLTLVVGGLAGVGIVAVAALGVGGEGRLPSPPEQIAGAPRPQAERPVEEAAPSIVPDEYAPEVALALSAPYQWEEPGEGAIEEPAPDEEIVVRDGSQPVRYLGSIIGPDRRLAIVSIDGHQRILAQGAGADGVELVRVEDDRIIIRRGGAPESIAKAERTGPSYTVLAASAGGSEDLGGGGVEGDPERDEMRRMLEERRDERLNMDARDARYQAIRERGAAGAAGEVDGIVNKLGTPGVGTQTTATPAGATSGGTASSGAGTTEGRRGGSGATGRPDGTDH